MSVSAIKQTELSARGPSRFTALHRINDRADMHDEFEEGGFRQSGRGRLRGQAGPDDFLEFKHIAFKPGTIRH